MIEFILGLVPDYGLVVLVIVVIATNLAVPLPSSMLVLAAGGFAASEDLILWQVVAATLVALTIGDQIAFHVARWIGPRFMLFLRKIERLDSLTAKAEEMIEKRGLLAVFFSHTIVSPTGPYVSFICGATGMKWLPFSAAALSGAALWTAAYVGIGYSFAGQLSQVSDMLGRLTAVVIALIVIAVLIHWLRRAWRNVE